MMKVAGHKNTYIYELDGYDHGSMAAPAFHIFKESRECDLERFRNPVIR